jgi:hypothetical protein
MRVIVFSLSVVAAPTTMPRAQDRMKAALIQGPPIPPSVPRTE